MTSTTRLIAGVLDTLAIAASAGRVAGAVEYRRAPAPRDLERLGIDPAAFGAVQGLRRAQSSSEDSRRSASPRPRSRRIAGSSTAAMATA